MRNSSPLSPSAQGNVQADVSVFSELQTSGTQSLQNNIDVSGQQWAIGGSTDVGSNEHSADDTRTAGIVPANNPTPVDPPNAEMPVEQGAVVIPAMHENPRNIVPRNFAHAKDLMRLTLLDNSTCKSILKIAKIAGAQNAKVVTKLKVIATKMTQRQFCVNSAIEAVEQMESGERVSNCLDSLRPTSVKVRKTVNGTEDIVWLRGDLPVFDGDEIVIGKPDTVNGEAVQQPQGREPDFEASELCRLLHTLVDSRMTTARAQLMEPRTREELDMEPFDPWTDQIAPLFNDVDFKPQAIERVAGGVTRADISCLDPSQRIFERDAGVLKRKFGEFKSAYGTCLSKYESSGQGDPDSFVLYANAKTQLMYAFCFIKQHPLLQPLATRALQSDAQREEGVGDGVSPSSELLHGYGRKRKRDKQEISIMGIESISSALRPLSESAARETEEAERDKARYEAAEAKGKSARSLLSAIAEAKNMLSNSSNQEERNIYDVMVKSLMSDLAKSFSQ